MMIALIAMGTAQQASAAVVGFDVNQMINMTVESSNGLTPINGWSAAPTYGDGVTMQGQAGADDNLSGSLAPGGAGFVYWELDSTGLADLQAAMSNGDEIRMRGFNDDNNDDWVLGVWFADAGGTKTEDTGVEQPDDGQSTLYSVTVADVAGMTGAGVYIGNPASQGDTYHASFSEVPEPGTLAVWALMGGLGLVTSRRRKS